MSFLKSKWLWIAVILCFIGYRWWSGRSAATDLFVTAKVERGDVSRVVSASASLTADEEIDLNFETIGRIKSVSAVVGRSVTEGDLLATMESVAFDAEVEKARAALDRALADAGVNDDALGEARDAEKNAKEYAAIVEDAEDQKVDAADKAYDNAVDYESAAQSYYDQVASDNGAGSATSKSAKLTLLNATHSKESAKEAKESVRRNRDVAVKVARNAYEAQKEKVNSLESKHREIIEDSAVSVARSNYALAKNNAEKTKLFAAANGTITQVNYQKGEVIGSAAGKPFGKLLSADLILESKIPESDIAAVELRQSATVVFDALDAEESFEATVVEIEPAATVIQDVVYYKVSLRLNGVDQRLKPGMSGDVDIHIAEKKQVVFVSSRAVKQDGQTHFVEVKSVDGKNAERRMVVLGLEGSDGQVEIVSGLNEGDEIIMEKK